MRWIAVVLAVAWTGHARADQCALISREQAMNAAALLLKGSQIVVFCEPCGEGQPGPTETVSSVSVASGPQDYWEVTVNGTSRDIAYLYLKAKDGSFQNLAMLAGCPVQDVSRGLAAARVRPSPNPTVESRRLAISCREGEALWARCNGVQGVAALCGRRPKMGVYSGLYEGSFRFLVGSPDGKAQDWTVRLPSSAAAEHFFAKNCAEGRCRYTAMLSIGSLGTVAIIASNRTDNPALQVTITDQSAQTVSLDCGPGSSNSFADLFGSLDVEDMSGTDRF